MAPINKTLLYAWRKYLETNDRVNSHEFYKINKYPPPQISSPPLRRDFLFSPRCRRATTRALDEGELLYYYYLTLGEGELGEELLYYYTTILLDAEPCEHFRAYAHAIVLVLFLNVLIVLSNALIG